MERKERLQLLLAYGFMSLVFGFIFVLALTFVNFPFYPGTVVAVITTLAVFASAFYCSARVVSKYLQFTNEDVKFLLKLTLTVGLAVIAIDIISGGTKITTLISNLSFLVVFLACTEVFLKPKTEETSFTSAFMRSQTYAVILMLTRMVQAGYRYVHARLKAQKTTLSAGTN